MMSEKPQFARLMVAEMIGAEDEARSEVIETRLVRPMLALLLPLLGEEGRDSNEQAPDGALRLIASFVMGGLVISTRPFLSRLTPVASDEVRLQAVVSMLMTRLLSA